MHVASAASAAAAGFEPMFVPRNGISLIGID